MKSPGCGKGGRGFLLNGSQIRLTMADLLCQHHPTKGDFPKYESLMFVHWEVA